MIDFTKKRASVLKINPPRSPALWWNGRLREDLLTFDEAGYRVMYENRSMNYALPEDVARQNIIIFLNDILSHADHDFDNDGPIHLDEAKVKSLLSVKG